MTESCGTGGRRYTKKYLREHGLGKLKKGELHGYHAKNGKITRHRSLRKTVRSVGALSTFRKLNALAVYTKNSAPSKSKTIKADRNWIKKTFMKGGGLLSDEVKKVHNDDSLKKILLEIYNGDKKPVVKGEYTFSINVVQIPNPRGYGTDGGAYLFAEKGGKKVEVYSLSMGD